MSIEKEFQTSVPLGSYTTFGIGGPADYFLVAQSLDDLIKGVFYARKKNIPFFVLGKGANILVGDKGFRGLVIKNEAQKISIEDMLLTAESGVTIEKLIQETAKRGLSGLEHYAGIPSTLGGAMWQNLHFLSPDRTETVFIGEIVKNASILDMKSLVKTVPQSYFEYGYDTSILHREQDVVLTVTLQLKKEDKETIKKNIDANLLWRQTKHPKGAYNHSAGSVFKNIPGKGAGRLIDAAGLKGTTIGGAQVSTQHANFILNNGNATAKDVRELVVLVQKKVKEKTNLSLQPEISFIGDF